MYPIKLYFKNYITSGMLLLSFLLNITITVWLLWHIRPQEETVFLHYNILFGVDDVGEWWRVLYLPATGFVILLVNLILSWWFYQKDRLISYVLQGVTLFCQVFLLIVSAILVFLN